MKERKGVFLLLSVIAAFSIIGIGVFLGERSALGMIISFLILSGTMIFGFKLKRKIRES